MKFENVGFDYALLHLWKRRSFCFPDDFEIIVNELILNFEFKILGKACHINVHNKLGWHYIKYTSKLRNSNLWNKYSKAKQILRPTLFEFTQLGIRSPLKHRLQLNFKPLITWNCHLNGFYAFALLFSFHRILTFNS